jgi:hypothetical protein
MGDYLPQEEILCLTKKLYEDRSFANDLDTLTNFLELMPKHDQAEFINWAYGPGKQEEFIDLLRTQLNSKDQLLLILSAIDEDKRLPILKRVFLNNRVGVLHHLINDHQTLYELLELLKLDDRLSFLQTLNQVDEYKKLRSFFQNNHILIYQKVDGSMLVTFLGDRNELDRIYNGERLVTIDNTNQVLPRDKSTYTNPGLINFIQLVLCLPVTDRLTFIKQLYPETEIHLLEAMMVYNRSAFSSFLSILPGQADKLLDLLCSNKDALAAMSLNLRLEEWRDLINEYPEIYDHFQRVVYSRIKRPTAILSDELSRPEHFLVNVTIYMAYVENLHNTDGSAAFKFALLQIGFKRIIKTFESLNLTIDESTSVTKAQLFRKINYLAKFHIYPFAELIFGERVDEKPITNAEAGLTLWPED